MDAVQAIKQAEELYYMANGSYTDDWDALTIDLPGGYEKKVDSTGDGYITYGSGKTSYYIYASGLVYGQLNTADSTEDPYLLYQALPPSAAAMNSWWTYPGKSRCVAFPANNATSPEVCKSLCGA